MSAVLVWRTVTRSSHPQFMVKGTELSNALCGERSRFQLCEIRSYDADGNADRRYVVRDAEAISDADVNVGKRPPVVSSFSNYDEALAFVHAHVGRHHT